MLDILTLSWIVIFSFILYILPESRYSYYFKALLVFGIIVGISILLFPLKIERTYGFLLIGLTLIIGYKNRYLLEESSIGYKSGILHTILANERFFILIPLFGFILLFFHSIIIIFYFNNRIGTFDRLVILQAFTWILYNYIITKHVREKDFFFLFLNFLSLLFLFPILIVSFVGSEDGSFSGIWAPFVNVLLAEPLGLLLNKIGYIVIVENDSIWYQDTVSGVTTRLWIAKSCSGINSVIIFLSAYIAYLISNKNLEYHMLFLVFLGILISYLSNLFRMVIIVIIGHYYGIDALLWAHENIGWIIFTTWMIIFWKVSSYFENEMGRSKILSP